MNLERSILHLRVNLDRKFVKWKWIMGESWPGSFKTEGELRWSLGQGWVKITFDCCINLMISRLYVWLPRLINSQTGRLVSVIHLTWWYQDFKFDNWFRSEVRPEDLCLSFISPDDTETLSLTTDFDQKSDRKTRVCHSFNLMIPRL